MTNKELYGQHWLHWGDYKLITGGDYRLFLVMERQAIKTFRKYMEFSSL